MRHAVDIMAINETWLRAGEEGRAPAVPGYRLRHRPRPPNVRSRGGGVGFYVRDGLTIHVLKHPEVYTVEQMWLKFISRGKKIVIGTAYRPPWLDMDTFFAALTESISSFVWSDYMILVGDFNINVLNEKSTSFIKLNNFLTTTNLKQHVTKPTHFTSENETLLDLICSDCSVSRVEVDYISDLSNHAFITCTLNIIKEKPKPKWMSRRSLKNINLTDFNQSLTSFDWDAILLMENVDEALTTFTASILALYDIHAPKKTFRVKSEQYPWITHNMKLIMKDRDDAQIRAKLTKQRSHIRYYNELRNYVKGALNREKKAYFDSFINANTKNPKALWKHLKKHIRIKPQREQLLPPHLRDPNCINMHFLDTPGPRHSPPTYISYFESHRYNNDAVLTLKPVTDQAVWKAIRELSSQAVGSDDISLDMLKLTTPSTLKIITHIINISISSNTFPTLWRNALVQPIPKKDHPDSYKDLRPISILPCMSKILEKIVYKQVVEYLEANRMLPDLQSGFRRQRGTATALTDVVDNIIRAQDRGDLFWYPDGDITSNRLKHSVLSLLQHRAPAAALDALATAAGRKPTMIRVQNKLEKASACLEYFTTRQWAFADGNVRELCASLAPRDRESFDFDVSAIDWDKYIESYVLGIRCFLFKESPETLPKSRRVLRRLHIVHTLVQVTLALLAWRFLFRRSRALRAVWARVCAALWRLARLARLDRLARLLPQD
ncbi:unnamed protein product [Colias eurytheme]|nr:unnamed protein product [Colias eurytheme]